MLKTSTEFRFDPQIFFQDQDTFYILKTSMKFRFDPQTTLKVIEYLTRRLDR